MLYPELKEDGKTIPCFCCKRSCGQWKMKYVDDEFFLDLFVTASGPIKISRFGNH
jgi:hypothetical protein